MRIGIGIHRCFQGPGTARYQMVGFIRSMGVRMDLSLVVGGSVTQLTSLERRRFGMLRLFLEPIVVTARVGGSRCYCCCCCRCRIHAPGATAHDADC